MTYQTNTADNKLLVNSRFISKKLIVGSIIEREESHFFVFAKIEHGLTY